MEKGIFFLITFRLLLIPRGKFYCRLYLIFCVLTFISRFLFLPTLFELKIVSFASVQNVQIIIFIYIMKKFILVRYLLGLLLFSVPMYLSRFFQLKMEG